MTTKNAATTIRKQQQHKECFVLRRYEIKKGILAGCVCHVVRSIKTVKGQLVTAQYEVMRYADGMVCCNCKAKGDCYHKRHVQEWEDATSEERKARHEAHAAKKAAQQAEATPAQVREVAAIAEQAKTEKQDAAKVRPNYETSEAASQRRMAAPLNGNQGFSLLKKAS